MEGAVKSSGAARSASARMLAGLDLPRVPRQARSRKKRAALLAAAAGLFAERGYLATTAGDIAAAAGVSIGTFYAYFRNKRQIFIALFAENVEALVAAGVAELDLGAAPREAIRRAVHLALERDERSSNQRRAWRELASRDSEIAAFTQELNRLVYERVLGAVRRVAEQGLTRPGLDVEWACWGIALLLDQAWQNAPDGEPPARRRRRQEAVADLIYHALFPDV